MISHGILLVVSGSREYVESFAHFSNIAVHCEMKMRWTPLQPASQLQRCWPADLSISWR